MKSECRAPPPPRSHVTPSAVADQSHPTNELLSSFQDVEAYRTMCSVFLQLLQNTQMEPQAIAELQQRLFRLKNIDEEITLAGILEGKDGAAVRPSKSQQPSHCSVLSLKKLVTIVERAMESTKDFQEKQQYLQEAMKKMILEAPRTVLDAHSFPFSKIDRFRNQFPRKKREREVPSTNEISLKKLRESMHELGLPKVTDYFMAFRLLKTCFGHGAMEQDISFSPIFNIIYDKSGKLIISADEDGLIKLWSSETGLLLWSLRGHAIFMEKLMLTQSNKYLVSCSSSDGLRIWELSTRNCLAIVFCEGCIISVTSYTNTKGEEVICFADADNFYQLSEREFVGQNSRYITVEDLLVSHPIPRTIRDSNNMICEIDISPKGYPIVGLDSGEIIIFDRTLLSDTKPQTVATCQSRQHSKQILEIKWNKEGSMFASCSSDGTCRIWELLPTCFVEKSIRSVEQIRMPKNEKRRNRKKDIICSAVCWTCNNKYILASFAEMRKEGYDDNVGEGDIVVFDVARMVVLHQVSSKVPYLIDSVNVVEPHPYHENIALYCERSGRIVVLDIVQCSILAVFTERGFHLGHPNLNAEPVDARWNPNGESFAVSSEQGNISIYGYAPKQRYRTCPTEQFYTGDIQVFIYSPNRVPLTIDGLIDINSIDRGPLCSINKASYGFRYTNDIEDLTKRGYFNGQVDLSSLMSNKNCYNAPAGWMTTLRQQTLQSQHQEQVFKMATLSISESEMFDQRRATELRLNETLMKKIEEYNQATKNNIVQQEQKIIVVENPIAQAKKVKKFKKLRRDAVSSEEEQYRFDQTPSEDEGSGQSQEVILKRKRRRYSQQQQEGRHRRTTQQQIQELEEEYNEMERRNKRRKMLHRLEDEEDLYGAVQSDSKKDENPEDTAQMCKRCEIDRVQTHCQSCSMGYCENCREYRGRGQVFTCFECLVRNSRGQQERNVIREAYLETTRKQDVYVPQLGDTVYFFFQGYEELIARYYDSFNPKIAQIVDRFRLIDFDEHQFLRQNPECVVRRIYYLFPLRSRERVDRSTDPQPPRRNLLTVLELETVDSTAHRFHVVFIVNTVNYLVRKEVLRYAEQRQLLRQLQINSMVRQGQTELQIIDLNPLEDTFSHSTWKYILVREVHERLRRRNKHDRRVSIWELDKIPDLPFEGISQDLCRRMVSNIAQFKQAEPDLVEEFVQDVNTRLYEEYLYCVEVPICIDRIEKRLRTGYYRSIESLTLDVDLLVRNSETFNGLEHEVTKNAIRIRTELLRIIQSGGTIGYIPSQKHRQLPPVSLPPPLPQVQPSLPQKRQRNKEIQRKTIEDSESFGSLIQPEDEDFSPNQDVFSNGERRVTRSKRHQPARLDRAERAEQNRRVTRRTHYPE